MFLFKLARALVAPDMIVPPSSVSVDELVVMLMPLPTFRLPPRTKVPPDKVEPLIWASVPVTVNALLLLMVSVPGLEKLPAVVNVAPFAMVKLPVLVARFARAFDPPVLLWMVPPPSVSLAVFVVMCCAAPDKLRFASST